MEFSKNVPCRPNGWQEIASFIYNYLKKFVLWVFWILLYNGIKVA